MWTLNTIKVSKQKESHNTSKKMLDDSYMILDDMPQNNNSKFGDNSHETFQHSPPSAALSFDGYCCLPVKSRSDDILLPLLFFSLFFSSMGTGCAFIHGCSALCAKHSQTRTLRREHWKVWRTCEWDLQHPPSCNLVLAPFILIAAPTTSTSYSVLPHCIWLSCAGVSL
jgi:hypothetical protein